MRTTKNILLGLSLLLGAALMIPSAQAARVGIVANPLVGRAGGGAEEAGIIELTTDAEIPMAGGEDGNVGIGFISLRFSVPVVNDASSVITITAFNSAGLAVDVMDVMATASGNTVTLAGNKLNAIPALGYIRIGGVLLNLIGKTGTVTATLSLTGPNFPDGTSVATVISSIEEPLEIGDDKESGSIRPSGGKASATFTIKEGFAGAFEDLGELRLQILNVPENAVLTISSGTTTTFGNGVVIVNGLALNKAEAAVAAVGHENDEEGFVAAVAAEPATSVSDTSSGGTMNIDIEFSLPNDAVKEVLALVFDLTADSETEDLVLPVLGPDVLAQVTMWPTNKNKNPYFVRNYLPAGGEVVFKFAAAKCTLLFPYVVSMESAGGWDTGIALANPTGKGGNPQKGEVTFMLFPNDGEGFNYVTSNGSPGVGLDGAGRILAGSTYSVLASEILDAAAWTDDFQGHIFTEVPFAPCDGIGWVTDFATVNQAYKASPQE